MSFEHYKSTSVSELQRLARDSANTAWKKGKKYEPVISHTRSGSICTSWWGKSWCENLEQYADYGNRLERGRRYVRNGTLLDLNIKKGSVNALVQGSRRKPYSVHVRIDPLPEKQMEELMNTCTKRVSSLEALAHGEFPEELKGVFRGKGGLFPTPNEIRFDCSCPDWAYMCKHVACVMYGIGVKLDENPFYFFVLRGIDTEKLLKKTVENKVAALLENASQSSERILDDNQINELFSLDLD